MKTAALMTERVLVRKKIIHIKGLAIRPKDLLSECKIGIHHAWERVLLLDKY